MSSPGIWQVHWTKYRGWMWHWQLNGDAKPACDDEVLEALGPTDQPPRVPPGVCQPCKQAMERARQTVHDRAEVLKELAEGLGLPGNWAEGEVTLERVVTAYADRIGEAQRLAACDSISEIFALLELKPAGSEYSPEAVAEALKAWKASGPVKPTSAIQLCNLQGRADCALRVERPTGFREVFGPHLEAPLQKWRSSDIQPDQETLSVCSASRDMWRDIARRRDEELVLLRDRYLRIMDRVRERLQIEFESVGSWINAERKRPDSAPTGSSKDPA